MTRTINMQHICDLLNAQGVPAYVEQTGGGIATIYAGAPYTAPDGDQRYPAVAGPGWFEGPGWTQPTATTEDFYIGPDQDVDSAEFATDGTVACDRIQEATADATEEQLADLLARQVAVSRYQGGDDATILAEQQALADLRNRAIFDRATHVWRDRRDGRELSADEVEALGFDPGGRDMAGEG